MDCKGWETRLLFAVIMPIEGYFPLSVKSWNSITISGIMDNVLVEYGLPSVGKNKFPIDKCAPATHNTDYDVNTLTTIQDRLTVEHPQHFCRVASSSMVLSVVSKAAL